MDWIEARFSKKEVMRAGETMRTDKFDMNHWKHAWDVLSNWRAAHAYPMHALLILLRKKAREVNHAPIVVQRLKRTPSILKKLARYPDMKLHRMQDISGCRAILNNVRDVEKLRDSITGSRTRHKLHRVDDYILNPKTSGYRGVHLIYKYGGAKTEFSGYFVELQIRSKIQHAWATAVEIVDTFTSQALKASQGEQDWLDFFSNSSIEFAKLEKRPVASSSQTKDSKLEVIRLNKKLNAVTRLRAFAVATKHVTETNKGRRAAFYLLKLDENEIHVTRYTISQLEVATRDYLLAEEAAKSTGNSDVVLVSATSMHTLRNAFPNYFADSKDFLKYIGQIIDANAG